MSKCFVVALIRDFNRCMLRPYAEILLTCQEIVIQIDGSVEEIQAQDRKSRIGSITYASGRIIGSALSMAALGTAAAPATCGTSLGLSVAGGVIVGSFGLAAVVHTLTKSIQQWKTQKRVMSVIREKRIREQLSLLFDKLDQLNGKNFPREKLSDQVPSKQTKSDLKLFTAGKAAGCVMSIGSQFKDVFKCSRALVALRQGKGVRAAMELAPDAIQTSSASGVTWGTAGYILGGAGVVADIYSIASDARKLATRSKCKRANELDSISEVLLSSLNVITQNVIVAANELQLILGTHLSCSEDLHCDSQHQDQDISNFLVTLNELGMVGKLYEDSDVRI